MAQQAALALALVNAPTILILDMCAHPLRDVG
jgi:hypothetical protein